MGQSFLSFLPLQCKHWKCLGENLYKESMKSIKSGNYVEIRVPETVE